MKLTYFIFNNLRFQQDKVKCEVKRFDDLKEAIKEFNSLPKEYTTALGGSLGNGKGEIDFIHRRNGVPVLANDYKFIPEWAENEDVKKAISQIVKELGVEWESDLQMFGHHTAVIVPLSFDNEINSYFKDKQLLPRNNKKLNSILADPELADGIFVGDVRGVKDKLLLAVNEVYDEGKGWISAEKFFKELREHNSYKSVYNRHITKCNINYIDDRGHKGQADISPRDFALLKELTQEKLQMKESLDKQINSAETKKSVIPSKISPEEPSL